jgi:protein-disulfide isomerase
MLSTENKILIGIVVVTVALLGGGVYFLTKGSTTPATADVPVEKTLNQQLAKTKGNQNAKVKIVEYADFECPACAASKPIVDKVLETYKDQVYFEYHYFPLPVHKWGRDSAAAGEAAAQQGKFWEMYNVLYTKQPEWTGKDNGKDLFAKYAQDLGLDTVKYAAAVNDGAVKDKIQQSINKGNELGVNATPTFFINGKRYEGGLPFDEWKKIIDAALK